MKLLLDEHLSPEIARRLRERGHDVVGVGERAHLRGRPDRVHFASLPEQQRVIVTRDLADFRPLLADELRRGVKTAAIALGGEICWPPHSAEGWLSAQASFRGIADAAWPLHLRARA